MYKRIAGPGETYDLFLIGSDIELWYYDSLTWIVISNQFLLASHPLNKPFLAHPLMHIFGLYINDNADTSELLERPTVIYYNA